MNIESVKVASQPQRTPTPEGSPKIERARNETPKVTTKSIDATKSQQTDQNNNQDKSATLSVEDAVKRLADFVAPTQSQISFSIDEDSGMRIVKILDTQSKEVIRQFPSEEAIALAQALDKIQGLLIKDKA
jgi:flagellar protein FlaG